MLALAEERGKQVRLTHPSPEVIGSLESCGLNRFLPMFGVIPGAVAMNSAREAIA